MDNKNFPTPDCVTEAIHTLITSYPGKYVEMAKRLDPISGTDNALRNRVRQLNGQMIPIGMVVEMEAEAGANIITEALCKTAGGVFVKLPVIEIDNDELLKKFNLLVSRLGEFCSKHNEFTADGVLDKQEQKKLKASGYAVQALVSEIVVITEMIFGDDRSKR